MQMTGYICIYTYAYTAGVVEYTNSISSEG